MEIVIDIPEETYEALVINQYCGSKSNLENIIINGELLPKNHGRLIDADFVSKNASSIRTMIDINIAPTIIEADKCTYKETGCGSCKKQLDCPIEAEESDSKCRE